MRKANLAHFCFCLFFLFLMGCARVSERESLTINHTFTPHPLIKNAHLQTIVANYYGDVEPPESKRELITLPDGDKIALEVSTPQEWTNRCPTVLLVHGLGGSDNSPYIKRMAHRILEKGGRAIRMNLRGCGSGKGLAKKGYHGGVSADLKEVIHRIYDKHPLSPISLVGFSLGGNITLKLLGEDDSIDRYLERAVAVCPAVHLEDSARRFEKFSNRIYQRSFLNCLVDLVTEQKEHFPDALLESLERCKTLYEFDEIFTAPFFGFESAKDYYTKSSSIHLIPNIKLKTHILFAKDDPLVNGSLLTPQDLPGHIELMVTERGGHMGFLGHTKRGPFRWMDYQIMQWLELY